MYIALFYTPELEYVIDALSSPLALVASIWLITATRMRSRSVGVDMQKSMFGLRKDVGGGQRF
jgi:hypothetical protein